MLTTRIHGRKYKVADYREAAVQFLGVRDALDLGSSQLRDAPIFDGKVQVAYISYNGRVWGGESKDWTPETKCLFDGRAL